MHPFPHLTPTEEAMFLTLVANEYATKDQLAECATDSISAKGAKNPGKVAMTLLNRLRSKLEPLGVEIANRRYKGWYFPPSSREVLQQLFDTDDE